MREFSDPYPHADQADGLRRLFHAQARVRLVPVAANPHVAFAGMLLGQLCTAIAAAGGSVLLVDAAESAPAPDELSVMGLQGCIEPLAPRLGYLAADPAICDALRIVRLPYHLSATTQATASVALSYVEELLAHVDDLRAERDATVAWLREQGHEVADSDANFVLFGRFADRHAVWQGLVDRGVLIRETGPDGWLRVSIGTADEMAAFRSALTDTMKTQQVIGTEERA